MFCLGSHKVGRAPPPEYNDPEKCADGWLPEEAVQLEAPAGSAIVYDRYVRATLVHDHLVHMNS